MTLLRRRAPRRSCRIHGDNGCEIQGEAGRRERAHDVRAWRRDMSDELDAVQELSLEEGRTMQEVGMLIPFTRDVPGRAGAEDSPHA